MFKIITAIKKGLHLSKYLLLISDTLQFFHDEAEKRGLSSKDATAAQVSKQIETSINEN